MCHFGNIPMSFLVLLDFILWMLLLLFSPPIAVPNQPFYQPLHQSVHLSESNFVFTSCIGHTLYICKEERLARATHEQHTRTHAWKRMCIRLSKYRRSGVAARDIDSNCTRCKLMPMLLSFWLMISNELELVCTCGFQAGRERMPSKGGFLVSWRDDEMHDMRLRRF